MTRPHDRVATWTPAGFFHLRSTLLAVDEFIAFGDGLTARGSADAELAAALDRDRDILRTRLTAWVSRPVVREALYLASRVLDGEVDGWLAAAEGEADANVTIALYKYFARMSGRPTPFGLFAGCTSGRIGDAHELMMQPQASARRLTDLDSGYASLLGESLAHSLGNRVVLHPNASLYSAAGRLRYVAVEKREAGAVFRLEALTPDPPLEAAIAAARDGAVLTDVVSAVSRAVPGAASDAVEAYVRALAARDILVADLEPALTGMPPLDDLIARVARYDETAPVRTPLETARARFNELDAVPLGDDRAQYRSIISALEPLGAGNASFQVDLARPLASGVLGNVVAAELHAGTLLLQRMFRTRSSRALAEFRQRFVDRYEQREVPLVEVLDEECGIGFAHSDEANTDPSPLLAALGFPAPPSSPATLGPALQWLLPRVSEALRTGARELRIEPAAIDAWERGGTLASVDTLPDAFLAIGVLEAVDDAAVHAGDFRVVHCGAGSQGASLLGRFCQRDDALRERVDAYLRAEEALRPDAVYAEIVYRPDARLANVSRRPLLRSHEIPMFGRSGAPPDRQIALSDLMVSVWGGRVRLRSARLNREVIPRLSSALDANRRVNIGAVRFLSALVTQEGVGVKFSWGALASMPVLPRVVSGRVVLSRARWLLDAQTVERLRAARGAARFRVIDELRARTGMPRLVGLESAGDAALPMDLENIVAIDALARLADPGAALTELLPTPGVVGLRGPEGRYAHEFVVPFIRTASGNVVEAPRRGASIARTIRTVPPGGAWLYARLYGGRATADRVLTDAVAPLARALIADGAVDRWFFLRYNNPDDHLRVRLHGNADRLACDVVPRLHAAAQRWIAEGMIWKVELDTYEREVERYGGAVGMQLSEDVFAADSHAVVCMLDANIDGRARWQQTLLSVHHLLLDAGLDAPARLALLTDAEAQFGVEFHADVPFWARVGKRFRAERVELERLLSAPTPTWIAERSRRLGPVVASLRDAEAAGALTTSMTQLTRHYVHLHVNRAMRSSWREHEFIMLVMLARLEQAARARSLSHAGGPP